MGMVKPGGANRAKLPSPYYVGSPPRRVPAIEIGIFNDDKRALFVERDQPAKAPGCCYLGDAGGGYYICSYSIVGEEAPSAQRQCHKGARVLWPFT